ncbi:MAG TPA: hypothetical protein VFW74_06405 [Acidimicrobiia bacterium]|nr:hypothetical protein [Acidimicrobiia bacterium]
MTTLLLVGLGAVGTRAARQLVDTPAVSRLLVTDHKEERAEMVADALGDRVEALDWSPDEPLPESVGAVACAVGGDVDPRVADRALEAGVPFASSADDTRLLHDLLARDRDARTRGVAIAVGCGLAPGLSDVLARHAGDALDSVDEVHVARAGAAGPASAATVRHARHEHALEWHDGRLLESRRRVGAELVWFPDPIGALECTLVANGVELLASSFTGLSHVTVRYAEPPEQRPVLRWLRPPVPGSGWGAARVEVWGSRGRARESIVYGVIEQTSTAAGSVLAVTVAGLAGALDVLPTPAPVGAHGLAALTAPVPFLAELAARGVRAAVFEGVPVAS